MGARIFKLNRERSMPGHAGDDFLMENETGNYQWTTLPMYEMAANQVEGHPEFFTEYIVRVDEPEHVPVRKQDLELLRSVLVNGGLAKGLLLLDKIIEQIQLTENGTN